MVVANLDVDSLCAVKILQTLLQCDHVAYTLVPIEGKSDLIRAFEENVSVGGVKYVVMINCGATLDLVDFLDPPQDLVIFVADSHRPIDVCNVYNDGQIRLLSKPEDEEEDLPEYDDIFRDDSDEEDLDDDLDDDGEKRRRFDESTILKRRDRRIWEEKRAKLLFEYQQFSYTGTSTAVLMYELAWKMSRDTNDLLWWGIVGHTEQLLMLKSEADKYVVGTSNLRDHVSRLNTLATVNENGDARAVGCMKLAFDKELNLNLYRHWSIYQSLLHTVYTAAKFKIWTLKGKQKLSEFLAELGLPLAQCKQKFSTMDLGLRTEVRDLFGEKADKYGLEDITYGSFMASFGFRHRFCAADVVYASLATMEQKVMAATIATNGNEGENNKDTNKDVVNAADTFLEALDGLSRSRIDILEHGIDRAKSRLSLIMRQVQTFLDLRTIVCAGPFLYAVIQDGTPDSCAFGRPNCLALLAHATLRAHVVVTTSKKVQALPLVISAPLDTAKGTCLVLGVPPVTDHTRKNLLGKAFEQAAKRTGSRYLLDYFDSSVIQLKTEDRSKFFDGLISLLA